jgi:rsbT antagonist protein RsbS
LKASGIPIQVNNDCVVASIQVDLSKDILDLFRNELLEYCSKVRPIGVVLDVSGQQVIDDHDFENLQKITNCAKMMGYPTVLSGFRPGVVAALVVLDLNFDGITATRNLDEAFLLLAKPEKTIEEEEVEVEKEDFEIIIEDDGDNFD